MQNKIICNYEFKANRSPYPTETPYHYCRYCPHEDRTSCAEFEAFTPQGETLRFGKNAIVLERLVGV